MVTTPTSSMKVIDMPPMLIITTSTEPRPADAVEEH
jgi:hypothetical protein